jgi:heme/copper-type cytochrome/quinol oxidase subunit 2
MIMKQILLEVNSFINGDNPLFVLLKPISFLSTSKDVIMHFLYRVGVKSDAVPGRLNQSLAS